MLSAQENQQSKDKTLEIVLEAALSSLAKALKAMNFYPPEHPLREESASSAYLQIKPLLEGKELVLLWSRDACTLAERTTVKCTSLTARSLAREMLTRKLQRLIILPELSTADLKAFMSVVTTDPAHLFAEGGIEKVMLKAGITTICANEVDLLLLRGLSKGVHLGGAGDMAAADGDGLGVGGDGQGTGGDGQGNGEEKQGADETVQKETPKAENSPREEDGPGDEPESEPLDIQFSMLGIDILLGMLKAENRESPFLQLAREVIDSAEELKRQEAFDLLLPVIESLLEIHAAEGRAAAQKEFIRYALEQIASGTMTAYLLDRIEERAADNEFMLDRLCATVGQSLAYPLIQRLCVAESLHTRKTIAIALTRSGEAAIPALVSMLKDERWYVVRNMVTILGEISSPESIKALQTTALHPEAKVRKEVVKALIKVAPHASENGLVPMLADMDREVVKQVIFSLGIIRSKAAVRPLLNIAIASDAFLKELELKKLAVASLGRIGDHQATGSLVEILSIKGWLAPRRWLELKTAAATALGQLGDESALPVLKHFAKTDSLLGEACAEAADNLERVVK